MRKVFLSNLENVKKRDLFHHNERDSANKTVFFIARKYLTRLACTTFFFFFYLMHESSIKFKFKFRQHTMQMHTIKSNFYSTKVFTNKSRSTFDFEIARKTERNFSKNILSKKRFSLETLRKVKMKKS